MAKRTSETYSEKTNEMAEAIENNGGAPADLPERYTDDGIMQRREHVWKFMSRRVPQTVMAKILGVSRRTIANDVKALKEQCRDYIDTMKHSPDTAYMDIGLTALRLEGVAQAAMSDYELARTAQHKNMFLNTAIKAETARSTLLIQTGMLPKSGEDITVTHSVKPTFSSKMGEDSPLSTLDNPASRRKILAAAEKILRLSAAKSDTKQIEAKTVDGKPTGK